jgi:Na+-driven multidrug efflux pump
MAEMIGRRNLKFSTIVYVLCGIVYFAFGMEILGVLLTDKNFQPLLRPHRFLTYVEGATIVLTVLSPFVALCALANVRRALSETSSASLRFLMWLTVVLAVLVFLADSMWTCSGHPTWIQGFPG